MKVQGVNAITIGVWAVILVGLFFLFGFGPIFFGAMLAVALVWRFVDKKKKGEVSSISSSAPPAV
ncbi:MAG: hypothetical protein Q8O83_04440 [bacterium]|nr:hypothetical protein [bacterium]